jgi:hypothetical protein
MGRVNRLFSLALKRPLLARIGEAFGAKAPEDILDVNGKYLESSSSMFSGSMVAGSIDSRHLTVENRRLFEKG